jgi:uncharacterized membrane protein
MRILGPGHLMFALGMAGIGILNLYYGDFALQWQPVPKWVPDRELLAQISGVFLIACGVGMFLKRVAAPSALALAVYLLFWLLLLKGPPVIAAPLDVGIWLGFAESLALLCGGWVLFLVLAKGSSLGNAFTKAERDRRIARILFAFSCLVFGLSHFMYAKFTATMVPAWLPYREGFAWLTGAGHFAAGLGILFMVLPRLAATLEAAMMTLFVLLVHIPGVVAEPGSRLQWTMLCVAAAMAGAAWAVANSMAKFPWTGRDAGRARTFA